MGCHRGEAFGERRICNPVTHPNASPELARFYVASQGEAFVNLMRFVSHGLEYFAPTIGLHRFPVCTHRQPWLSIGPRPGADLHLDAVSDAHGNPAQALLLFHANTRHPACPRIWASGRKLAQTQTLALSWMRGEIARVEADHLG